MNKQTYNRSRLEILHYILQFSTPHYFGDKKEGYDNIWTDVENCFKGGSFTDYEIEKDSLCVLSACKTTKWYMSWCVDIKEGGAFGSKKYLMKSIEDGELCWWENVSVWQYPKQKTDLFPHWKWEDAKWDLWDKWRKVFQKRDAFGLGSIKPNFNDDGSVTLSIRERWSEDIKWTETFPNWKKLTQKAMLAFYDKTEAERKRAKQTVNEK